MMFSTALRDLLDTFQVVKRRYYPGSEKYGYCPSGENVDSSQVVKIEKVVNNSPGQLSELQVLV